MLVQIGGAAPAAPDAPGGGQAKLAALRDLIAGLGSALVAYSGGVDSSLVLAVAVETLGERALGVIGRSDSYAERELALALEQAAQLGARIEVVATGELSDPTFRSNPVDRCYHCKTQLYRELDRVRAERGAAAILDGTIADDLSDWRPGRRAAAEHQVRSPLAELGFTKAEVRAAAAHLGLASRDKPASPCLASRIPYGVEIDRGILRQVEQAEEALRVAGFVELRVRYHGEVARIEVPLCELPRFADESLRKYVVSEIQRAGFRYVALDLEGFRSGSLNSAIASADRPRGKSPDAERG